MKGNIQKEIQTLNSRYAKKTPLSSKLATMPHQRDLHELNQRYGNKLEAASHGESFLNFFQARFVTNDLYLLNEPEAALSPISQLAFISILKRMVAENAQFIIATHSPILMAFPGAVILDFDSIPRRVLDYEISSMWRLLKAFWKNRRVFLNTC